MNYGVGGVGGSGAVLQAVIGTGNTAGQIISITVVNGGYNYATPPTIVITDSAGAGATALVPCQRRSSLDFVQLAPPTNSKLKFL